jgi:hypothetical protein
MATQLICFVETPNSKRCSHTQGRIKVLFGGLAALLLLLLLLPAHIHGLNC